MSRSQAHRCPRCESPNIIPDTPMVDKAHGGWKHSLEIDVAENPQALFFKENRASAILADICGECGHIELRAKDPRSLWAAYTKRRKR